MQISIKKAQKRSKQMVKDALRRAVKSVNSRASKLTPDRWSMHVNEAGHLAVESFDLDDLAKKYGTPLHIIRADCLEKNIEKFKSKPDGRLTACEVYYSYKTNPIPGTLRFLHERGIGAEVISHFELDLALGLNVPPENIIYNGPAKSDESLEIAIKKGIRCINANSLEELARIGEMAKRLNKTPNVGLRITTMSGWSGQFGLPVQTGEALSAFRKAIEISSINLIGLHAHRGTQIRSADEIKSHVGEALAFSKTLRDELGVTIKIVNFGGSLACPTVLHTSERSRALNSSLLLSLSAPDPDECIGIEAYVDCVLSLVEEHAQRNGMETPTVCLEPGRAMTANSQLLLCSVMTTKPSKDGVIYAVLDAGINVAESVLSEYHQLFAVNKIEQRPDATYRLVGPICTPGDVLYHAWDLPNLETGDTLAIMDSGAYFVPFETIFSFPRPPIVMLQEGQTILIRRRETFEEMTQRDGI